MLPFEPIGSEPVTETGKLRLVPVLRQGVDVAGRRRRVHQPRGRQRAGAGVAILVGDAGGVDRQRVLPSAVVRPESPPICRSSRTRRRDRDGAGDQVGPAVVGQGQGMVVEALGAGSR